MTRTLTAAALAFTALLAAPALAQAQSTHPFSFPQPSEGEEFFRCDRNSRRVSDQV